MKNECKNPNPLATNLLTPNPPPSVNSSRTVSDEMAFQQGSMKELLNKHEGPSCFKATSLYIHEFFVFSPKSIKGNCLDIHCRVLLKYTQPLCIDKLVSPPRELAMIQCRAPSLSRNFVWCGCWEKLASKMSESASNFALPFVFFLSFSPFFSSAFDLWRVCL